MKIIEDEGLFYNSLIRKNHFDKSIAGAGLATNGAIATTAVKTAIGGAYITKIVGGISLPAWLPAVGGKVLFGTAVTEFSAAAFMAVLNPVLISAIGISSVIFLIIVFSKKRGLSDRDMCSLGDEIGNAVASLVFLPLFLNKDFDKNKFCRNLEETMIYDFGYSPEFVNQFIRANSNKENSEIENELKSIYKELMSNKDLASVYKKFKPEKVRKYVKKRIGNCHKN